MAVHAARYPLLIRCSLSPTLSSVKHILQDVNRKAQNHTCKQPFRNIDLTVSYRVYKCHNHKNSSLIVPCSQFSIKTCSPKLNWKYYDVENERLKKPLEKRIFSIMNTMPVQTLNFRAIIFHDFFQT